MGICWECGSTTKGKSHQCTRCKKREKAKKYKTPNASLTQKEKENMENIRIAYDPGYAFEKLFQNVMNSVQ